MDAVPRLADAALVGGIDHVEFLDDLDDALVVADRGQQQRDAGRRSAEPSWPATASAELARVPCGQRAILQLVTVFYGIDGRVLGA